jgi:iron(III) transport system permease protein
MGWITIPQIWPWVVVAGIWIAIAAANELVVVDQFQIDTYARHLFTTFAQETPLADTYAVLAPSTIALLLVGTALALALSSNPPGMSDLYVPALRYRFGLVRWVLGALLIALMVILSAVPFGNLLYQVGHRGGEGGIQYWSFQAALQVLVRARVEFGDELQWTFVISSLAATAALVTAIFATAIARRRSRFAFAPWLVAAVLLSIPAPMIGLWLIPIVNWPNWDFLYRLHTETVFSPVVATALRSWPICFVLCWFAARDIPRDVIDNAALDRATLWQQILYIELPLSWRAWLLSWLVGFALSSGELAATQMVIPPGASTVATRIFGLIHTGVREKEAALCLWHAGLCAILALIAVRLNEQHATALRGHGPHQNAGR